MTVPRNRRHVHRPRNSRRGHARTALLLLGACVWLSGSPSRPDDQVRIEWNRYADTFGVDVIYPSITLRKQLSSATQVSGRYVVDAITSASMKSQLQVDGITSATRKPHGGSGGTFDEVRQEAGLGVSQSGRRGTISGDILYSREHDYRSFTLAALAKRSFALQNTEVSLAFLHSWDQVFPVTRTWSRQKNVTDWSLGWSQVLARRTLAQAVYTHTTATGYLTDPYQVVTILDSANQLAVNHETRHPDRRDRNALGLALKQKLARDGALELGYRRYWDSWSVDAHDIHADYTRRWLGGRFTMGIGLRRYLQSRAEFFRPRYDTLTPYRTADLRLDSGHSTQVELHGSVPGTTVGGLGIVAGEALEIEGSILYYRRVTSTRDWHRRSDTLASIVTRLSLAIHF